MKMEDGLKPALAAVLALCAVAAVSKSRGQTSRQASPRQASPRQASPRQASPRRASPRRASKRSQYALAEQTERGLVKEIISTLRSDSRSGTRSEGLQALMDEVRRVSVSGVPLASENLSGLNLSDLDLSYSSLVNTNLRMSDLAGSDLTGTSLADANLSGADLTNADLTDADLRGSDLRGADLSGVRGLESASRFSMVFDQRTRWPKTYTPPEASIDYDAGDDPENPDYDEIQRVRGQIYREQREREDT